MKENQPEHTEISGAHHGGGEGLSIPAQTGYVTPNNTGLPTPMLQRMERSFDTSLRDLKVVTDSPKPAVLQAKAMAHKNTVEFAPGHYNPHTAQGQREIGHEIAHVIQQRKKNGANNQAINRSPIAESEADTAGRQAAMGKPATVQHAGSGIQLLDDPEAAAVRDRLWKLTERITVKRTRNYYLKEWLAALHQIVAEADSAAAAKTNWIAWLADAQKSKLGPIEAFKIPKRLRKYEARKLAEHQAMKETQERLERQRAAMLARVKKDEASAARLAAAGGGKVDSASSSLGAYPRVEDESALLESVQDRAAELRSLSERAMKRAQIDEGYIDEEGQPTAMGLELLLNASRNQLGRLSKAGYYFLMEHHRTFGDGDLVLDSDQSGKMASMMHMSGRSQMRGNQHSFVGAYKSEPGHVVDMYKAGLSSQQQAGLMRTGSRDSFTKGTMVAMPEQSEEDRRKFTVRLRARSYLATHERARYPASALGDILGIIGAQLGFWRMDEYYSRYMPMRFDGATTATGMTDEALARDPKSRAMKAKVDAESVQVIQEFLRRANQSEYREFLQRDTIMNQFLTHLHQLLDGSAGASASLELERATANLLRSPERVEKVDPLDMFGMEMEEEDLDRHASSSVPTLAELAARAAEQAGDSDHSRASASKKGKKKKKRRHSSSESEEESGALSMRTGKPQRKRKKQPHVKLEDGEGWIFFDQDGNPAVAHWSRGQFPVRRMEDNGNCFFQAMAIYTGKTVAFERNRLAQSVHLPQGSQIADSGVYASIDDIIAMAHQLQITIVLHFNNYGERATQLRTFVGGARDIVHLLFTYHEETQLGHVDYLG